MLRLAFDFIITWRETRTRPNAYVFNGGIILPDGRKLMAVREPAGYGMRISGVSPGSARESGMEM